MSSDFIDYGKLIDDAMHVIVKQALGHIKNASLPGRHHFFISFLTSYPGVQISKSLRERYPEEMTIVLQHQFQDLKVTDEMFSVVLSFDNVKENIVIPFGAMVAFADPSVKFGLQFSHMDEKNDAEAYDGNEKLLAEKQAVDEAKKVKPEKKGKDDKVTLPQVVGNVVDIDTFRKK